MSFEKSLPYNLLSQGLKLNFDNEINKKQGIQNIGYLIEKKFIEEDVGFKLISKISFNKIDENKASEELLSLLRNRKEALDQVEDKDFPSDKERSETLNLKLMIDNFIRLMDIKI